MAPQSQTTKRSLERVLLKCLGEHRSLGITDLGVRVRHGVAYLEGSVPNSRQKRLAGAVAGQVEGVKDTVNMLRIASPRKVNDGSLRIRVRRALARDLRIDADGVSVNVVKRVVHLDGFVATAAERRIAEDAAKATHGVRGIINNIEVISAFPKIDIQIAGEILQGLSLCFGLDLSEVAVDVQGGVVHLRGVVPSDHLASAAEELARWTPRVRAVVNELRVPQHSDQR